MTPARPSAPRPSQHTPAPQHVSTQTRRDAHGRTANVKLRPRSSARTGDKHTQTVVGQKHAARLIGISQSSSLYLLCQNGQTHSKHKQSNTITITTSLVPSLPFASQDTLQSTITAFSPANLLAARFSHLPCCRLRRGAAAGGPAPPAVWSPLACLRRPVES